MCEMEVREKVDVFQYQSGEGQEIVKEFYFGYWV